MSISVQKLLTLVLGLLFIFIREVNVDVDFL